jgi:CheY-like chemotaxis protein
MKALQCIMLVDDDPDDIFLHTREIKKAELAVQIIVKENAKQALEYLKEQENSSDGSYPDVIFLDINMPAIDGWEFLEKYSKLDNAFQERVKVFMLSTSSNPADKLRAKQWKFVYDYIEKPLTKNTLEDIIEKYFNRG